MWFCLGEIVRNRLVCDSVTFKWSEASGEVGGGPKAISLSGGIIFISLCLIKTFEMSSGLSAL